MGAVSVVELLVLGQRVQQVVLVPGQCAVQQVAAAGPFPAFHDRVHVGYLDAVGRDVGAGVRSEEHTSELQSPMYLVAELAGWCAQRWLDLADTLQARAAAVDEE